MGVKVSADGIRINQPIVVWDVLSKGKSKYQPQPQPQPQPP